MPDIGPARLEALLDEGGPERAWQVAAAGRAHHGPAARVMGKDPAALAASWARAARDIDFDQLWQRHVDAGVRVAWREDDDFPELLRLDPYGPALIVWKGTMAALDGPRVAIVGTRDCTQAGREFAVALANELSDAGVRVVSGLALGIDAAAHSGALSGDAPPIGVVGSGLDVVYPRRNAQLWTRVARDGVLLTEHPLGARPIGWHFLARNRIIAALADVVVVVESHEHGGSLQTATEAARRGVPVLAVPGSVRSAASQGSNALLREADVCCDVTDVLGMLGLASPQVDRRDTRTAPQPDDALVLEAIGWEPCGLEALMVRTGRPIGELALALDRLEVAGWIARRGGWTERVGSVTGR